MENTSEHLDCLNRNELLDFTIEVIKNKSNDINPSSFTLEGDWGSGKTWIINNLIAMLSKDEDYIIIKYNAWENDYYEEPLFAIINSIQEQVVFVMKHNKKNDIKTVLIAISKSLGLLASISSKRFLNGEDIVEDFKKITGWFKTSSLKITTTKLDQMNEIKFVLSILIQLLNKICEITTKQIIFIVDEIDRCTPSYAIKNLERLHHIFNQIDYAVLITSVDKTQLDHVIRTMFGENTSIDKYLGKFRDFSIKVDYCNLKVNSRIALNNYISRFNMYNNYDNFDTYFNTLSNMLTPREMFKVVEKGIFIHDIIYKNENKQSYIYLYCEIMVLVIKYYQNKYPYNNLNLLHYQPAFITKKSQNEVLEKMEVTPVFNYFHKLFMKTTLNNVPFGVISNYNYDANDLTLNLNHVYMKFISKDKRYQVYPHIKNENLIALENHFTKFCSYSDKLVY